MLAAVGRTSMQSLQRRFFVPKKGFSERELAFFLDIDFETHVALVAQIDEDGHPIIAGGGRYIVVEPGHAEIAFVVVDDCQGQGIGTILVRHLAVLAQDADRGPGIPVDRLKDVFEPFFTTKAEGMRMGLSIARTIVEAHNGQISAVNEPGAGAVFRIKLPISRDAAAPAQPALG
jgi:GNAT superfamily N-acetyltransferase